jgi:hypothetical protein
MAFWAGSGSAARNTSPHVAKKAELNRTHEKPLGLREVTHAVPFGRDFVGHHLGAVSEYPWRWVRNLSPGLRRQTDSTTDFDSATLVVPWRIVMARSLDCFLLAPDTPLPEELDPFLAGERGVIRIDGFAPLMIAGLAFLLLGPPAADDPHTILHAFDLAEPFHREGLGEDFPDEVLDRLRSDAGDARWWLWRIPEPLLGAVAAVPADQLESLAERWETCRVVFLFRSSYDLAIQRPPLRDVLSRLRRLAALPRPHGAWLGWRGEA